MRSKVNGIAKATDLGRERVALYLRVSTDEQADRKTIEAQRDFLRNWARLYELDVYREYADDGYSGTLDLSDRPDGRELLADAAVGHFGSVVVYRLDRLARKLTVLLDAHIALERADVAIRSASEPFDTSTPFGKAMFQFLGVMAELDRSTTIERLTGGRDRAARSGKWTGGPIPFGLDLNSAGCLMPSARVVDSLGLTEAEVARSVLENIAEGSSTVAEARRLNALGVPTDRRYGSGATVTVGENWLPSRINQMVKNPVYAGEHIFKSRGPGGPITRQVPALVDRTTWEHANAQLTKNRALSTKNRKRDYLLRGLVTCGNCGSHYAGSPHSDGRNYYYRCNGQLGVIRPEPDKRCRARRLSAAWLEDLIWADCRDFARDPGPTLEEARRQLRARLDRTAKAEGERRGLQQALAGKEAERERVLTMFRRGRITMQDADRELDTINAEAVDLRARIEAMRAQVDLVAAVEAQYAEAAALLHRLRDQVDEIDRTDDRARKRQVIELLVAGIRVDTAGEGRDKTATVRPTYHFGQGKGSVVTTTDSGAHSRRTGSATS